MSRRSTVECRGLRGFRRNGTRVEGQRGWDGGRNETYGNLRPTVPKVPTEYRSPGPGVTRLHARISTGPVGWYSPVGRWSRNVGSPGDHEPLQQDPDPKGPQKGCFVSPEGIHSTYLIKVPDWCRRLRRNVILSRPLPPP